MSGIIGQGQNGGLIGNFFPSNTYAYGNGGNSFGTVGNKFGFSTSFAENMVWSETNTKITPNDPGTYLVNVTINFLNESPSASEDDSGNVYLRYANATVAHSAMHFHVTSSPTSAHEGVSSSILHMQEITGTPSYFHIEYADYTGFAGYNENIQICITRIK